VRSAPSPWYGLEVPIAPDLLAVLVCPVSRQPLRYLAARDDRPEALLCIESRRLYRIDDGVPILLAEEAALVTAEDLAALTSP
jgi:hypothetical protein